MHELPPALAASGFRVADGRAAGLGEGRMRGRGFGRPFHGIRTAGTDPGAEADLIARCRALAPALHVGIVFSHATAARLWRMPVPTWTDAVLHTLALGATPVRRPGVIGWIREDPLLERRRVAGLRVTTPADTWVALAVMRAGRGGAISREDLVAAGDFIVSGERLAFGRAAPLATIDELAAAVERHGSGRGARALAWALPRIRRPVDSPAETRLRLGLVAARLPEPVVQPPIPTAQGLRHPDLGYLDERVLLEYLGDVHRTDRSTWRKDLTRVQLFEDAGYRPILVGADDISPAGLPGLAARVRRALRGPDLAENA